MGDDDNETFCLMPIMIARESAGNEIIITYIIPELYCALFIRNTFKGAFHRVAATRAQVHPLPMQLITNADTA